MHLLLFAAVIFLAVAVAAGLRRDWAAAGILVVLAVLSFAFAGVPLRG